MSLVKIFCMVHSNKRAVQRSVLSKLETLHELVFHDFMGFYI